MTEAEDVAFNSTSPSSSSPSGSSSSAPSSGSSPSRNSKQSQLVALPKEHTTL